MTADFPPSLASYLKKQYQSFTDGLSPPDYPNTDIEEHYSDRATPATLTDLGRLQMGMPVQGS